MSVPGGRYFSCRPKTRKNKNETKLLRRRRNNARGSYGSAVENEIRIRDSRRRAAMRFSRSHSDVRDLRAFPLFRFFSPSFIKNSCGSTIILPFRGREKIILRPQRRGVGFFDFPAHVNDRRASRTDSDATSGPRLRIPEWPGQRSRFAFGRVLRRVLGKCL